MAGDRGKLDLLSQEFPAEEDEKEVSKGRELPCLTGIPPYTSVNIVKISILPQSHTFYSNLLIWQINLHVF